MMRSLGGRLFLSHLLVVAVALAAAALLAARADRAWLERRSEADLLRAARLGASWLAVAEDELGRDWPAAADSLAARLAVRVTLIAADGRVLGDSNVPRERLGALENHGSRPEVLAARALGRGANIRRSATTDRDLLYVAIPAGVGEVEILRLAEPVALLGSLGRSLIGVALPALLVALGLGALLVLALTRRHAARVADLESVAHRIAAGEAARAVETPEDEVGRLGRAVNHMAAEGRARLDALRRERDEREHILAQMSDGVALIDAEGRIVRANHSLAAVLDKPRPAEAGTPFVDYARNPELHELVRRARSERRAVEAELRVWTPHPRLLHAGATLLDDSEAGAALLVVRDLTEIERLGRVRQDFVANVSHELRTPLTSIRGYAETLLEGALEDAGRRREFVGVIRENAVRLEALVADLLSLAELERPGAAPRLERVDLRALAGGQVAAFRPAAERAGLSLELEPGEAVEVAGDRPRLEQVLANLLDNAIKYTDAGGVRVRVGGGAGRAWCEVEDSGPGIPAEHQSRVFERFYRVDKARSRERGGTGLGLSIVRHIVALHGGVVSLTSAPGAGSTFRFEIPAAPG